VSNDLNNGVDPGLFYQKLQEYVDWNIENLYKSQDDELLFKFIKTILGFHIPRNKVCDDHCAPLDFVADSFYDRYSKFLTIANRNGGKTQNYGLLNALDGLCKPGCEVASVGAIEDQAKKCYKYTTDILKKPYFTKLLAKEPMISLTTLTNGAEISVLPGTMSGVNGPHPQKTNFDEVELTQWKVLMEFMSMAKSTKTVPATVRITSTRKFSHGPMQRLINEKDKRGFKLYMWCIWETIERCPDERSGNVPCWMIMIDPKTDKPRPYKVFSQNKDDYGKEFPLDVLRSNREKYTGCLACPLVEVCQTKAKRSDGYYDIKDTIDKFTGMDRDTWDNQWECKKPGKSGLVYGEFDETVHVIPRSSFTVNPNYRIIASQDFGYEDPAGTIFMQFLPNGDAVIFDELYIRRTQTPVLIKKHWVPKQNEYQAECWIADSENADAISQMSSAGIPVMGAIKDIVDGLDKVRGWLRTADGYVRLYVCDNCVNTIAEFNSYSYPESGGDKPIDKNNHLMDPIRYIFNTLDEIGNDSGQVDCDVL
jgi:Phage terminase large subunit